FGKHDIDVMAGYQQESSNNTNIGGSRSGYPTDLVWVLDGGPTDNWKNNGNGTHWALASFVARANYAFDNKYMLSGSVRVDGSSRFKKENRWATFAAVSGAWRISQEKFMASTKNVINDLKIRASWGQTGAATGLGLYPSYSSIGMGSVVLGNSWMQTAYLSNIGNPELSWELTEMVNVGLDFRTLNNRLSFTGEYYIKTSKDILIGLPVPMEYGFGKPNTNIGKMRNNGWELELAWRDTAGDFNYSVSANISDNRNKVLDLGGTGPWKSGSSYTEEGKPFGQVYGYESMGLFQTKEELKNAAFQKSVTDVGDVRYKDQNDDKKINSEDRVVLGDQYAHFIYGARFAADYRNFDLSVLFQGIGQKNIFISDYIVRPLQEGSIYDHQLDYWSKDNTGAKYPRILNKEDGNHNYEKSDFWKQNAGYLRVKNLQVGYTFGKRLLGNSGFDSIRLYFSANNLFTISNITTGIDPETSNSLTYPFARTYSFGLNVQF
ncbi:MAG: SusC/RagA family TonB-linked outer membrane protein, partial [Rikenellaceae bacterium]